MPFYASTVGFMASNPHSVTNSYQTSPFNPKYLDKGLVDSVTPAENRRLEPIKSINQTPVLKKQLTLF